uniref:Putative secreted protein n=1 Tax=Anopheles marajoara TaxID=58244 RepID=A0A2M4CE51_9DIPT
MRQPFLAACLSGCFGGRCRIMMVSSLHTFTSLETRDRGGGNVPHLSHTCRHDAAAVAAAKLPLVVRVFFY